MLYNIITIKPSHSLLHWFLNHIINTFTENKMTINCNTKIPYFPFTNPFKIHLPGLKQATKPFHYEIQSLTCTQSLKKWKQFNNWSVQSIKKIAASLLFLISNSSHLATISNFNLLMSKQKPRVFREKQQTILTVVTQGNPPRKTSNNI